MNEIRNIQGGKTMKCFECDKEYLEYENEWGANEVCEKHSCRVLNILEIIYVFGKP